MTLAAPDGSTAPVKFRQLEVHDVATGRWLPMNSAALARAARQLPPPMAWKGDVTLRERPGYRGMAWVACRTQLATLAQSTALLAASKAESGLDPFVTALTEERLVLGQPCAARATARVLEQRPGYWRIRTDTDGTGVLVVSSAYHRGWVAREADNTLQLRPVDGVALGVPVGSGVREIILEFRPPALITALWCALAALILVLLLLAWGGYRTRGRTSIHN